MTTWSSTSEADTRAVGRRIGRRLRPRGAALLSGDLGAGKTVFTRGVAEALGIDPGEIQSPTFTLVREHEGSEGRLVHVDLYRLEPDDVWDLGIEDLFAGSGVKVVEWAERLPFDLPGALRLKILRRGRGAREITLETNESSSEETL